MKKTTRITKFVKFLILVLALFVAGTLQTPAQIISPNTTIDWTQCGARGGIPSRTSLIDVTQSPYNADKTGTVDATLAIQTAINAAANNQVVYFPDGRYLVAGTLTINKSYVTLRGNTNSVLIGVGSGGAMLTMGFSGDENGFPTDTIISGSNRGSTSITLSAAPSFGVGDIISIAQSDAALGTAQFPIINVHQYDYNVQQQVIVTAISGNMVTISDPLIWNFTNAPVVLAAVGGIAHQDGVENLTFITTNSATGATGSYAFTIWMADCADSWVTNCPILYSHAYAFYTYCCSHLTLIHNTLDHSLGSGSDHSGFNGQFTSGSLFADNIIADGLQPGFEFNQGFTGNAVFGNFFTNNIIDVDCHNTHPMMNLWEENVLSGYYEIDGYFGSCSHQTLLRNAVQGTYIPLMFKRWTTYMNVVGNVLGNASTTYPQYTSQVNNPSGGMIIEFGFPNIGNNSYNTATSPSTPWNYPCSSYPSGDGSGQVYQTPIYTFPSDQAATTTLLGNFTNITSTIASLGGPVYTLVFQDGTNPNLFYPTNGKPVYAISPGTAASVVLNTPISVKAGWKVYIAGQNAWQQLQTNDQTSDNISGNFDYYHKSVTWNSSGAQTIPSSLLYPGGAPSWWGTNRWPAIDPVNAVSTTLIPAQSRFLYGASTPATNIVQKATLAPPTNLKIVSPPANNNNNPTNSSGLIAWWKFIETSGTTENDSSGNGNTGNTVGSPGWQNPGLLLNGSSQYVAITPKKGLPLYGVTGSNNLAVSLWVYIEGGNNDQVLYGEGASGGGGRFLLDFNNSANPNKVTVWLPSTYAPNSIKANTTLSANTWYNIVWTDNNGSAQLYINGSPDTANFSYTPAASGATTGVGIGVFYDGQAGDTYAFVDGIISDVRLWNYSLPSSQVSSIYTGGRATQ